MTNLESFKKKPDRGNSIVPMALASFISIITLNASAEPTSVGFEKSSVYWIDEGAPEIVDWANTPSGPILAYTNSDEESVGFLGLSTDPGGEQPMEITELDLGALLNEAAQAEPTAVATTPDNRWFVIAVNTSVDASNGGSGVAVIVDAAKAAMGSPTVVALIPLPGQPDSIAASTTKSDYVAIAIENETDEDSGNNLGKGSLVVIQTKPRHKPDKWKTTIVDLTGLPIDRPEDPEPEFVDVNDQDVAVLSLQENNAIVIVDLKSKKIKAVWDAGAVTQVADTTEDDIINFGEQITDSPRTPDAVAWLSDGTVALANEGEANFTGGRGVSVHDAMTGAVVFDPRATLELQLVRHGHYNDGRSANKGAEFEGLEVGTFWGTEYLFGAAERGAGITVQTRGDNGYEFVQLLPMIGESEPEGIKAIPGLGLLVTADEENGKIVFYKYGNSIAYPNIVRPTPDDPATAGSIGWGALSGLSDGPGNTLYAIPDSAYASSIYILDVSDYASGNPVRIVDEIPVTDPDGLLPSYLTDGNGRALLDLEGIAASLKEGVRDLAHGAWLVSEGENRPANNVRPNLLIHVTDNGVIDEVVNLPFPIQMIALEDDDGNPTGEIREVSKNINRFGFEGVTTTGSMEDGEVVFVAFQRSWGDDASDIARIGRYVPETGEWSFYGYELDGAADNPGLSEIVALGSDTFAVIERDGNNGSVDAPDLFKLVKEFSIAGKTATPNPDNSIVALNPDSIIIPNHVFDLVGSTPGDDLEKWEGLAVKGDTVYAVNDNDGSGETRLVTFDTSLLTP